MGYTNNHNILAKAFSLDTDAGRMKGTGIDYRTFTFSSDYTQHLPDATSLPGVERDFLSGLADNEIIENKDFRYPVFMPEGYKQTNRAIVLLHGLNEKSCYKYLT